MVPHRALGLRAEVRVGKEEAKQGVLGPPNLFYLEYLHFFSVLYIVFCLGFCLKKGFKRLKII